MADPIYLELVGREAIIAPTSITDAIRYFVGILRDMDATITQDSQGTIRWGIESIEMHSPAVIAFRGQSELSEADTVDQVEGSVVRGIHEIHDGERPDDYSDAVLRKVISLAKLSERRDPWGLSVVHVNYDKLAADITPKTIERISEIVDVRYESKGTKDMKRLLTLTLISALLASTSA